MCLEFSLPQQLCQAVGRIADFDLAHVSGAAEKSAYHAAKRIMDLTLSILGVIALAPLMATAM